MTGQTWTYGSEYEQRTVFATLKNTRIAECKTENNCVQSHCDQHSNTVLDSNLFVNVQIQHQVTLCVSMNIWSRHCSLLIV